MRNNTKKIMLRVTLLFIAFLVVAYCIHWHQSASDLASENLQHLLGVDIMEVKREFEEKGLRVSGINGITGKGEFLSMTVDMAAGSSLDSLGYSLEMDLEPWRKGELLHLRVRAGMDGKVTEITDVRR